MSQAAGLDVEVFTQSHCAACRQVEAYLQERGVTFVTRDVSEDPAALDELIRRGYMGTPVTRIGSEWVAGFHRRVLDAALLTGNAPS